MKEGRLRKEVERQFSHVKYFGIKLKESIFDVIP